MKRRKSIAALLAVGIIAVPTFAACENLSDEAAEPAPKPKTEQVAQAPKATPAPKPAPAPKADVGETVSQENARESAESYLGYSDFSRSGLIEQLEFEGYSNADATYAADTVSVNWNGEAADSARSYLEYSSFSRSGLIEQLQFEGFTPSQAQFGVNQTGL